MGIRVRLAMREDVPSIRAIYNDAIINTTAVYSYEPVTLEYQARWFETKQQQRGARGAHYDRHDSDTRSDTHWRFRWRLHGVGWLWMSIQPHV